MDCWSPSRGDSPAPPLSPHNPEGVTVISHMFLAREGVFSSSFDLPELVSFGTWTIEASYPSAAKQRFKATFNVKEYVLPSFDVQLIPNKTFFYLKDEALGIDIQAWWKLRSLSSQRSSLQPG
ncbi:complement C3-like isoform X1 [Nycticebus coucang]|uniref:complement C3-like isoform X1 n=1 Tax=Nycticebus coucang TaxID=9470 RepID=UPI00234DBE47|nr:complement C3-like isoform X1 [Nycticebus coucang]